MPQAYADAIASNEIVMDLMPTQQARPGMSFRSVLADGSATAPFLKLAVALYLTSTLTNVCIKTKNLVA